jgi:hypothetical protein
MVLKYFSRLVINTIFLMAISVGILCSVGDDGHFGINSHDDSEGGGSLVPFDGSGGGEFHGISLKGSDSAVSSQGTVEAGGSDVSADPVRLPVRINPPPRTESPREAVVSLEPVNTLGRGEGTQQLGSKRTPGNRKFFSPVSLLPVPPFENNMSPVAEGGETERSKGAPDTPYPCQDHSVDDFVSKGYLLGGSGGRSRVRVISGDDNRSPSPLLGMALDSYGELSPRAQQLESSSQVVDSVLDGVILHDSATETIFQKIFNLDVPGGVLFKTPHLGICIGKDIGTVSFQSNGVDSAIARINSVYFLFCPRKPFIVRPARQDGYVKRVFDSIDLCEHILSEVFTSPRKYGFDFSILTSALGEGLRLDDVLRVGESGPFALAGRLSKDNRGDFATVNHYHLHFVSNAFVTSWSLFTERIRRLLVAKLSENDLLMDEDGNVIEGVAAKALHVEKLLRAMGNDVPPISVSRYANTMIDENIQACIDARNHLQSTDRDCYLKLRVAESAEEYQGLVRIARGQMEMRGRSYSLAGDEDDDVNMEEGC